MGCLYAIDFPSGKRYIGITTATAEERFKGHVSAMNKGWDAAVSNALRKYGPENVAVRTLALAECVHEKREFSFVGNG